MKENSSIRQISNMPFFFILGRPRSGTTLLRTLLDAHPNVNIPLENSALIHLYFKYRHINKWKLAHIDNLFNDMRTLEWIQKWKIDWNEVRHYLSMTPPEKFSFETSVKILYFCYQSEAEKEEIKCLGDKSPLLSLYSGELFKLFPDARFIHLVRDYRANLASMNRYGIFSPSETGKLMQWRKSVTQISRLAEKNPLRILQIRYEDLASQPGTVFRQVCGFLQVPYLPGLLDASHRKLLIGKIYNDAYINEWQPILAENITAENVDKWKQELSPRSILKADYVAGATGPAFSYNPVSHNYGLFFILEMEIKKFLFHLNECNRYLYDRLPFKMKLIIKNRRFRITENLIGLYRKCFEKG